MINIGYSFYKDIYEITNQGGRNSLILNENVKKRILEINSIAHYDAPKFNFFSLFTTYPGLVVGTGYAHGIKGENGDFKIGCYFDHSLGYPLVPGSSIKGVIRSVFPEIEKLIHENTTVYNLPNKKYNHEKAKWCIALLNHINDKEFLLTSINPLEISPSQQELMKLYNIINEMFEGKDENDKSISIYNRDIFYDAMPVKSHHKDGLFFGNDSITPHIKEGMSYEKASLRNPVPLLFYKILSNVEIIFNFKLQDGILKVNEKENLIKKILLSIGIGAKTNVGYGQLSLEKIVNNSPAQTSSNHYTSKSTNDKSKKDANKASAPALRLNKRANIQKNDELDGIVTKIDGNKIYIDIQFDDNTTITKNLLTNINIMVNEPIKVKVNKLKEDGDFTIKL